MGLTFYIDSYREKLKIFLSETRGPRPLIFDIWLYLMDLCQDCSVKALGSKMAPFSEGHLFYLDPFREIPI